jgi:hypothetical protein
MQKNKKSILICGVWRTWLGSDVPKRSTNKTRPQKFDSVPFGNAFGDATEDAFIYFERIYESNRVQHRSHRVARSDAHTQLTYIRVIRGQPSALARAQCSFMYAHTVRELVRLIISRSFQSYGSSRVLLAGRSWHHYYSSTMSSQQKLKIKKAVPKKIEGRRWVAWLTLARIAQ